jgi:transposase
MNNVKYIGMDVHKEAMSIAVLNPTGKLVMECTIETKGITILDFLKGLRGSLHVTFEEGTWAAWLYDLMKPHVTELVVCDPRRNALLKEGSKSDRIDARKLAELLRGNQLSPVYHGDHGIRTLKELGRSYLTITQDLTRVMSRIKALYRSSAIPCSGTTVYGARYRSEWLAKISEPGVRLRAERFYQQLDLLQPLRQAARSEFVAESHKHPAVKLLRQIPSIGPIRAALLVALLQTPHGFRTKRQLWAYRGFAVETHDSGEYRYVRGKVVRNRERISVRGLNGNYNRDLKNLFKSTAISASTGRDHSAISTWAFSRKDAAHHGPPHSGQEDRRHYFNHLEERGGLRRQRVRSASSLSISGKSVPSLVCSPVVVGRVLETLDSRASISQLVGPRLLRQRVTHLHAMPPRIIRNSDRPRASDRTMITTQTSISLAKSLRLDWHCRHRQRTTGRANLPEQNPERSGHSPIQWAGDQDLALALRSRHKFFLDIPFYRTH